MLAYKTANISIYDSIWSVYSHQMTRVRRLVELIKFYYSNPSRQQHTHVVRRSASAKRKGMDFPTEHEKYIKSFTLNVCIDSSYRIAVEMATERSGSSFTCFPALVLLLLLIFNNISFSAAASKLIFEDNFNTLNKSTWQQLITSWRGGQSQFQYYTNRTENRYFHKYSHILFTNLIYCDEKVTFSLLKLCGQRNFAYCSHFHGRSL